MDRVRELLCVFQVGLAGFTPDEVGEGRVVEGACNGLIDAGLGDVEAFGGAFTRAEGLVTVVNVAGQETGGVGVRAGDEHRGRTGHVGGETGGVELGHELAAGYEYLTAEVTALLGGSELVFKVDTRRTGLDHLKHQFVGIERSAKTGFRVGHDGLEVVMLLYAADGLNLIATGQSAVDALHNGRHTVGGVEALVGVHGAGKVGIACDLPAGKVDGAKARFHLLDGLITREGTEGVDVAVARLVDVAPEFFRSGLGDRVFDLHGATELEHFLRVVGARDTGETLGCPKLIQFLDVVIADEGVLVLSVVTHDTCCPCVPRGRFPFFALQSPVR